MQDATKVLLGTTLSTAKEISRHASDPASFPAGCAVGMASDGGLSLAKVSGGLRIGISLGRSLSDTKKTAVVRIGERIPMRAALKRSTGLITITSFANLLTTTPDSITVGATIFAAQAGAATLGTATFRAATSNIATATSLAAQINAHATAGGLVYAVDNGDATVTLYAKVEGAGAGNDVALAYTDNGGGNVGATVSGLSGGKLTGGDSTIANIGYMALGAKVYINDVTGLADIAMSGSSTISDAVYVSGPLTGIDEDGNSVGACIVDATGGL